MVLKMRAKASPPTACPMSKCMGLIGGLWTPEIIWSLSNGPRRFSELRRDNSFISGKVLAARLRELVARGVLTRSVQPTSPPTVEYELTPLGKELLPAIRSIVEVGTRLLLRDSTDKIASVAGGAESVRPTSQRPASRRLRMAASS